MTSLFIACSLAAKHQQGVEGVSRTPCQERSRRCRGPEKELHQGKGGILPGTQSVMPLYHLAYLVDPLPLAPRQQIALGIHLR